MLIGLLLLFLFIFILSNGLINTYRMVTTRYEIKTSKLTKDYTFVHISDYHSADKEADKIIKITKDNQPDYILLSGDILQSDDMTGTVEFVSSLTKITRVVYARGNHDDDFSNYSDFSDALKALDVIVLNSESQQIDDLNFIGIEDFSGASLKDSEFENSYLPFLENHKNLIDENKYNVLLAHRPNFLNSYAKIKADLVVSGHAHGGQWQIPFTNIGMVAPDEGYFPNHVEGLMENDRTYQSISAGTSNPYEPWIPRFFNPKEVVVIKVTPTEK